MLNFDSKSSGGSLCVSEKVLSLKRPVNITRIRGAYCQFYRNSKERSVRLVSIEMSPVVFDSWGRGGSFPRSLCRSKGAEAEMTF